MKNQNQILYHFIILVIVTNPYKILSTPILSSTHNSNNNNEDNDSNTDDINNVTNQGLNPITRPSTKILDLDNLDPNVLEQLRSNNINLTALKEEQALLRSKKVPRIPDQIGGLANAPAPLTQPRSPHVDEDQYRRE